MSSAFTMSDPIGKHRDNACELFSSKELVDALHKMSHPLRYNYFCQFPYNTHVIEFQTLIRITAPKIHALIYSLERFFLFEAIDGSLVKPKFATRWFKISLLPKSEYPFVC